jgi:cell division protein FtsX
VGVQQDRRDLVPPPDNADTQYRQLRHRTITSPDTGAPLPTPIGTFSQREIAAFDPLSRVPLGPYQPTAAAPADAASRTALRGADLLPSLNLGGYVTQPVQLITNLASLRTVEARKFTGDAPLRRAPISVIRVRVAGVTGPDPVSLARIKVVAQQIELRTHLTVDIVAGSSPSPTTVVLPGSRFGRPPLLLSENWVKKGVAVTILTAVDRSSVVLFVLILVVCALFVANSATAAVRGRRQELGVLAALGWTRPRLFTAVLGEVAVIGLIAGVLAGLLSPPLAAALGLHASLARATLAIPVAVALALAVQVRGVDYVAAGATIALGVLTVADALLISISERAPELAAMRALGWPESARHRLVITEGALTGIAGSVTGVVAGLTGAAVVAGQFPPLLLAAAAAAAAAGVLVTCLAALLPAQLLGRQPTAQLLARE